MNVTVPDRGEGIPNSLDPDFDGPRAERHKVSGQRLSLFVGIFLIGFYLVSSLWIASHRRLWYDEISTVLIARLPDIATIWSALSSAGDVLPATYFMLVRLFDHPLGPTEVAARIPSALGLAIGLLITFDCARRLTGNLAALSGLAMLTCSILPYYGYEARPYGVYFMLAATELWLWVHAPDNRKVSTILFGATFFVAFSVHYYSVLCLVPYGVFEASRWKPWRMPSPKLSAGVLGVLCGGALYSRQILAASTISRGFWAFPTRGALLEIFSEFFPLGVFAGVVILVWIAWTARPERLLLDPMHSGERLGWCFLLIPIAGYAAADFVTNAFYNRYFIGMLPGVAVALACALGRHFCHRPRVLAGIVLIMLLLGVGHQASVMTKPAAIEPPSNGGGAQRLVEALASESVLAQDGKKTIAVALDGMIGIEARYYSKHPERYAFVITPRMGVVARTNRNLAQYVPMCLWSLQDLRAAARETAMVEPSDEMLKAMLDAGFQIKRLGPKHIKIVYLE